MRGDKQVFETKKKGAIQEALTQAEIQIQNEGKGYLWETEGEQLHE